MNNEPSQIHLSGKLAAGLFIAQFVLIWTTFFVLSNAIGWPASLGDPAEIALPRLLSNQNDVLFGYGSYLTAALLLIPAVAALNARLRLHRDLAMLLIALAAVSATTKAIGITRWLFAMPVLAAHFVAPGADKAAISNLFDVLNAYAGKTGETLGVGLVSGMLTVLIGVVLTRGHGWIAAIIGFYTIFAGVLLLCNIPAGFGVQMGGLLTLSNIAWQFALLAIGLWSLTRARS